MRRWIPLLAVLGALALVALGASVAAAADPTLSVTVGSGDTATGGSQFSLGVDLLVGLTVLSVVPAILLLATSFTRIVVVLALVRQAIGVPNLPPNQVVIGLAMFLTMLVMGPTITTVNDEVLQPLSRGEITQDVAMGRSIDALRAFMLKQVHEDDLATFVELAKLPRPEDPAAVPTEVLLPAFVVGELKTAFTMGFLLYVPFLVIELIVAAALQSMGMMMVSPPMISLPFKLLLFVMLDGWTLLSSSLVRSFTG